jgi:hypothetical protein
VTFTIYEKHPTLDAYRYGPSFTPYAIVAIEKRLTDAELAAEYYAQQMEAVEAVDRAYPWGDSEEVEAATAKIYVLEAFASRPHAHETNYE